LLLDEKLNNSLIAPANIAFELTERATSDREVAVAAIRRLRERGHAVFIDDFGTGYSNLAYLTELNVDGIKINRSFIATIGTESVTASIVPQILAVAKALEPQRRGSGNRARGPGGLFCPRTLRFSAKDGSSVSLSRPKVSSTSARRNRSEAFCQKARRHLTCARWESYCCAPLPAGHRIDCGLQGDRRRDWTATPGICCNTPKPTAPR
jgi:hypothetical protein